MHDGMSHCTPRTILEQFRMNPGRRMCHADSGTVLACPGWWAALHQSLFFAELHAQISTTRLHLN